MVDMTIENIVISTQLATELDLALLARRIPGSTYRPEEFPGLILHCEQPKTAILLFPNGKLMCTGAKTMDETTEAVRHMCTLLTAAGANVIGKPQVTIQNIVASSDLKKTLNLTSIAQSMKSANVEYEPDQFPGLVYRMDDPNAVILIFSSGKMVCTGATSDNIATAFEKITTNLSSLKVL